MAERKPSKWPSAPTILAIGSLISVLLGGLELRMKVGDIDTRLTRIERTVDNLERTVGSTARNDE